MGILPLMDQDPEGLAAFGADCKNKRHLRDR
jgi:hypothetical protein